jgi:hypothetical protein
MINEFLQSISDSNGYQLSDGSNTIVKIKSITLSGTLALCDLVKNGIVIDTDYLSTQQVSYVKSSNFKTIYDILNSE